MTTCKMEDEKLIIRLEDRLDTSNAQEIENEINAILSEHPHKEVVLDVEDLNYISSAGLRVVLRLKKNEPSLIVSNASTEIYEIFEMTGFAEMMTVMKAFRKLSVDGCPVIGKGAKGTVYRYNPDTIIKVYKSDADLPAIDRERELARKAFVLGIPTAIPYDIVKVGDNFGSVFELLDAKSFSQLINEEPEKMDFYAKEFASLLQQIHTTMVKPGDMPDVKNTVGAWLRAALPLLSGEDALKLESMVEKVPDTLNMIHGDYHTNNIMMQNGEAILIDMDTLSHGHPIFELANIFIAYVGFGEVDPAIVENFIGFSYENTQKFFDLFLGYYFEGKEEAEIREIREKIHLMSTVRLIRHFVKRGASKEVIDSCVQTLTDLLHRIDTLEY